VCRVDVRFIILCGWSIHISIDHTCSNCAVDGYDINILYIWAPTGVEKINDKWVYIGAEKINDKWVYIDAEKIMFKTRIITVPIYNKTSTFSVARRRRSGATQVWRIRPSIRHLYLFTPAWTFQYETSTQYTKKYYGNFGISYFLLF
jgi:hypothetical protein